MGELNDTSRDITENLEKLINYQKSQAGSLEDPSLAPQPAGEAFKEIDTNGLKDAIQTTIKMNGTTSHASLLACYRDLDSLRAEAALRHRSRAEYWKMAQEESAKMGQIWTDRMQARLYNVTGQRKQV